MKHMSIQSMRQAWRVKHEPAKPFLFISKMVKNQELPFKQRTSHILVIYKYIVPPILTSTQAIPENNYAVAFSDSDAQKIIAFWIDIMIKMISKSYPLSGRCIS